MALQKQDRIKQLAESLKGSLDGGVRATFHGGETPTRVDTIDYINISTTGNATDFGQDTGGTHTLGAGFQNSTRSERLILLPFSSTLKYTYEGTLIVRAK